MKRPSGSGPLLSIGLGLLTLPAAAAASPTSAGVGGAVPVIQTVSPASVEAVVPGGAQVTLLGTNFLGTTQVSVDGIVLLNFPPQFSVVSNTQITLTMPYCTQLGPVDIVVSNASGPSVPLPITVTAPAAPVLELTGAGFLLSAVGADMTVGAAPGDVVYLLGSLTDAGSRLPGGGLMLDIGSNFNQIAVFRRDFMPGPAWMKHVVPLAGMTPGTTVFFQALIDPATGGKLQVSNMVSGQLLF